MKLVNSSFEIVSEVDGNKILKNIEAAGRTCYKSEDKITEESAQKFIKVILGSGHHSVIEHESISVRIVCDRGVSHEIVRHRIASYSQESTRYCNYSKDKFCNEITFIDARSHLPKESHERWMQSLQSAENDYLAMITFGVKPQMARSLLPNALKTELVMTCNIREWRTIFSLRTAAAAHPQMREIMKPLLLEFRKRIPILFNDVGTTD